jgi:hypothetical protein
MQQSTINGQMQAIDNQRTDAGNRQSTDRCRQSTILRRYEEEEEEQEQTYDEGSRVRCLRLRCLSILLKIDEKYTSRQSGRWQRRYMGQKMAESMYGPEDGRVDVRARRWQRRCTGQKMAEAMYGPEDGRGDVRARR